MNLKKECIDKKTHRSENDKKQINNRLGKIEGQILGIRKMIDNDAYCNDVLIQLAAVENAIRSLSNLVLENHLYTCIASNMQNGDSDAIEEVISLFKRFNRK